MKQPAADVVVAGKYCLEGQLATGGMGSVWVARHLDLDVPVAIKFMGPDVATSEEGRVRFEREAKAAAYLQSPHVVNVQDYGVDEGLAYIAMELLVGEDLEDRLFRVKRLSLESTLTILRQAAKALRRAQDLGIVHRDIKPQNLYLARGDEGEETLKILDFGIAKETGPTLLAAKGTNTGQIIGSPHYMSPEAVRGVRDIDFRSDLWSLGVIVFQCVTGRLPFPSEVVGDVMGMILADPLPQATAIAPDLPPEIDAFFEKALARDRNQRFQSAREMVQAFAEIAGAPSSRDAFSSRSPLQMDELTPSAPGPSSNGAAVISKKGQTPPPASANAVSASITEKPARPRKGAFAAAIALVALGAVALFVMRGSAPPGAGQPGAASAAPNNNAPAQDAAKTAAEPPSLAPPPASAATSAVPDASAQAAASASAKAQALHSKSGKGVPPKSTAPKRSWGF